MAPVAERTLLVLTVALSILVALTILEVGLRLARDTDRYYPYYPNSKRYQYPSEEITPGVSGVSVFTTNSFGTRGRDPIESDTLRILTIGGSTTACTTLDDSETWPAKLEAKLTEASPVGESAWVPNSGIDGLLSEHHLMHVKYLLPQLAGIDFVLVYAGVNDMGRWFHNPEFDPDFANDLESRIGEAFRWSAYTPADWPAYKRLALWKNLSRARDFFSSVVADDTHNKRIVRDASLQWIEESRRLRSQAERTLLPMAKLSTLGVALASYERTLSQIVTEARTRGVEPIFMAQAVQSEFSSEVERSRLWMGSLPEGEGYVSEDQYPQILAQYNSVMAQVASRHHVFFVDLPSEIGGGGEHYYDGMHFNERGADTVAQVVFEHLTGEAGIVQRVRP